MTRDERIAALRALIERQMAARAKAMRDVEELDEVLRASCGEFMDLVSPPPAPVAGAVSGQGGEP